MQTVRAARSCASPQATTACSASVAYPWPCAQGASAQAQFRHPGQSLLQRSFEVGKAKLADEAAGRPLLHGPIAEAEQSPVPAIAQHSQPRPLRRGRLAYRIAHDLRIGPHRHTVREVADGVTPEAQARCFDDGGSRNLRGRCDSLHLRDDPCSRAFASVMAGRAAVKCDQHRPAQTVAGPAS